MNLHRVVADRAAGYVGVLLAALLLGPAVTQADEPAPDFNRDVLPLFRKHCLACHKTDEPEGKLVLESFESTLAGGEGGPSFVAGQPDDSELWRRVVATDDSVMPPKEQPRPTAEELAPLRRWIEAGAPKPQHELAAHVAPLVTPVVPLTAPERRAVAALAVDPRGQWLAVARPDGVEIVDAATSQVLRQLEGVLGPAADVSVSPDGQRLLVAAGEIGLGGQATLWNTTTWQLEQTLAGHRDSLYAARLSPDQTLAITAGYDKRAIVWNIAEQRQMSVLVGHNDAIYGAAFHPSLPLVLTASGDRTVKLWNLHTGERLDTFQQPAKEQYSLDVHPQGRLIAAGGADQRLRIWEVTGAGQEGSNLLRYARFAHEGPIQKVLFSPDGRLLVTSSEDRRIKFWETATFTEVALLERQPDWSPALAFSSDSRTLYVGRLNGDIARYDVQPEWGDRPAVVAPLHEVTSLDDTVTTIAPDELLTSAEVEPNNAPLESRRVGVPARVQGLLQPVASDAAAPPSTTDADYFRFSAEAGRTYVLETRAQQLGSPADTRLDLYDLAGQPVPRAKLQAVRDSWITFRPIDSSSPDVRVEYWQEMDLNQYLYLSGEICKLFRAPQGPDSGFQLYVNRGRRRCYFDTSAVGHAKDEPVYIVEAFAPETTLIDNGLPVFPLYYCNDDDAERELGSDSRVLFTPAKSGDYVVRVSDVRGFTGADFRYELIVRWARPDFQVSLNSRDVKVAAGSGQRLNFSVDRIDGFDGDVEISLANLPPGFAAATPILIPAGHVEASSVLTATADATAPTPEQLAAVQIIARGTVPAMAGHDPLPVEHAVGTLGAIGVNPAPTIRVILEPDDPQFVGASGELVIPAGERITARIRVLRNGYDGDVNFEVAGLPHGVIVDSIGLSGVLVRKGETERQVELISRPWVAETTRSIFAVSQQEGGQVSPPVQLRVSPLRPAVAQSR